MNTSGITKTYLIILAIILLPCSLFAYETDDCILCHSSSDSDGIPQISVEKYQSSVHADVVACDECHTYIEEGHEGGDIVGKVNCTECHQQQNLHGAGSESQNKPECYSCHTRHNILPSSSDKSSVHETAFNKTCVTCHENKWEESGLMTWFISGKIKSHKKQDFSRDYSKTNCTGCHQGMAVHGDTEKVSDDNCSKCHLKDGENPMGGSFHNSDSAGLSINVIAALLMIILIFIFAAGFILNPLGKSGEGKE